MQARTVRSKGVVSSVADAKPGETITLVGAKVHILGEGATFDLTNRQADGASAFVISD